MKKITTFLFALAFLAISAMPVQANYEKFDVNEKVDKLKTELLLTDEQAGQVKTILKDYQDQMEKAHEDKMDKMRNVLTDDQMKKLEELKKTWKKEHKDKK